MNLPLPSWRYIFLGAGVLLYALAGSPTPDQPGLIEAVIGLLILAAAGMQGLLALISFQQERPLWFRTGQIFILFGLSVPLVVGALAGNSLSLIVRDVASFLFLALPLMFAAKPPAQKDCDWFLFFILALGIIFSLRSVAHNFDFLHVFRGNSSELFYFANAPTVLFSAVFLVLSGSEAFLHARGVQRSLISVAFFLISIFPIIAMAFTLQRASLLYVAGTLALYVLTSLPRATYRAGFLILLLSAAALVFADSLLVLLQSLADKTQIYGGNQRAQEWVAVWQVLKDQPLSILFGLGWGGTFESPAVAGIRVNYTHGLLPSLLLKTGAAGLMLGGAYIGLLCRAGFKHLWAQPIIILALLGPMVIDALFYASFKTLDFGLVLTILALFCHKHDRT